MGKPVSVLQETNAFARDYPRDRMPRGYAWDLLDYVPAFMDAQLTGRGPWKWSSDVNPSGDFEGGLHAFYKAGDRVLAVDVAGNLKQIDRITGAITHIAAIHRIRQNPVQHLDFIIIPDRDGANAARVVSWNGTSYTNVAMHSSALKGRYASVYKARTLLANAAGQEERVAFSPANYIDLDPAAPDNTGKPDLLPWDPYSFINTALPITGLGVLRSLILVFHEGSVERIRGSRPPTTASPEGDMFLESLSEREGCGDARSIAYWNDNCIFADERGVHFTDGAIIRNLCAQGGILSFWRPLYKDRISVAADTYLDYYIITIIRSDNVAVTLVCDLNRRAWFRLGNVRASAFIHSHGGQESLWGCRQGSARTTSLSEMFFPVVPAVLGQDPDGTPVLPMIETPWYRMAEEGRKRVRFAYLSYDARTSLPVAASQWRAEEDSEGFQLEKPDEVAKAMNVEALATIGALLELGYITSPHDTTYTIAGEFPATSKYERYRLAVRKNPYGIAFRVRQLAPSFVTRVYDLAVEAQANERSRL